MFYSVEIFKTLNPGDSISNDPERTAARRQREESGYIDICNKGQVI